MPNIIIFAFGMFVTSIFVAGVYTYVRIRFDQIVEEQKEKKLEEERLTAGEGYRQVPIRLADNH